MTLSNHDDTEKTVARVFDDDISSVYKFRGTMAFGKTLRAFDNLGYGRSRDL